MNTKESSAVAICKTHTEAEQVVKELQQAGYDMKKLSIVGKDYHQEDKIVGYYNTGDSMKKWGGLGAFWGGLWGFIFGAGFFFIPGIGQVAMAGPIVSSLVGGLEGAVVVGGLSALGADKYLVIAHGTSEEVEKAQDIMKNNENAEIAVHH